MTSNLRPKADRRKKTTSSEQIGTTVADVQAISRADIARKAYELYCARGGQNGSEVDDWLRAEQELLTAGDQSRKRTTRRTATLG